MTSNHNWTPLPTSRERPPMTDTITGWRTVATHGQPRHPEDYPVLIFTSFGGHFIREESVFRDANTRWIPLAELDALPDAPPPRTVTITIDADDARRVMGNDWTTSYPIDRTLAAVKAALEADEPKDD